MAGIYERKMSNAAVWCQRFAFFLVPYFALIILLHRFAKIETLQVFSLLALGFVVAILALVLAIRAGTELWYKGNKGGRATVRGTFLATLVLIPFAYHAYLALSNPIAHDIATDTFNPPDYVTASITRVPGNVEGMNPVEEYTLEYADTIVLAYPRLKSRRYPAGPERVLEAVKAIFADNEWPMTGTIGVPESKPESDEELADHSDSQDQEGNALEGGETPADILLEALVESTVFGFKHDVVVRIVSEDENTLVDIRSSSRFGTHDFGYNARLIEAFLHQLDTALLGIAGEG